MEWGVAPDASFLMIYPREPKLSSYGFLGAFIYSPKNTYIVLIARYQSLVASYIIASSPLLIPNSKFLILY